MDELREKLFKQLDLVKIVLGHDMASEHAVTMIAWVTTMGAVARALGETERDAECETLREQLWDWHKELCDQRERIPADALNGVHA